MTRNIIKNKISHFKDVFGIMDNVNIYAENKWISYLAFIDR